ncbi:MAG: hypothetical protein ACLQQ4_06765 [Bacteroidia bacterium]
MKTKNIIHALTAIIILSFSNHSIGQSDNAGKKNYTFATSSSTDGNTIYVSTVFCWICGTGHPCNGVIYGNSSLPCDFLQSWALSNFKLNQPGFDGINTTVACVTESLTMYYFSSEDSIQNKRNIVIDNYRNKQHKTIVIVTFPSCKD